MSKGTPSPRKIFFRSSFALSGAFSSTVKTRAMAGAAGMGILSQAALAPSALAESAPKPLSSADSSVAPGVAIVSGTSAQSVPSVSSKVAPTSIPASIPARPLSSPEKTPVAATAPNGQPSAQSTAQPTAVRNMVPLTPDAQAPLPAKKPMPEQWYTGSLASPSPALPQAGLWGVEPYIGGIAPHGEFDPRGTYSHKKNDGPNGFQQFTLAEYAFTNHLTLYVLPTYSYTWGNGTHHSSGLQINDFPIEFKYRFGTNYSPSFTISVGANAPIGKYSNLHNSQEGVGVGAWVARFGIETQLVYPFFNHQQRIRGWAMARMPFTSTSIKNASVYNGMTNPYNDGSWEGFRGTGHPGPFGTEGVSWEGGLTRGWLLALDLYHNWSAGTSYSGRFRGTTGHLMEMGLPTNKVHSRQTSWAGSFHVAPAIEYNWSPVWGAIAGCDIPVVGHNTSAALAPQAAVFYTF